MYAATRLGAIPYSNGNFRPASKHNLQKSRGKFAGTGIETRFMRTFRLPSGSYLAVSSLLLPWFEARARVLPWRENRTPYRVWISEAMLQQTRVETVIPYFLRWMERFPSVRDLADADQQDVLKAWEGLGYYARARNLHRAARIVVDVHGGELPSDPETLASLPGIGPYTVAAIGSLAFGHALPVLDGNVERVLTRLLACGEPVTAPGVKERLRRTAARLLEGHPPGAFNEAMMELGATLCLPANPRCGECPLRQPCRGRRSDPSRYPVKVPKPAIPEIEVGAAVTWRDDGRFLIARRHEKGLLGGMWEFPGGKREPGETLEDCVVRELREELDIGVRPREFCCTVRHTYSHFRLKLQVFHCDWTDGTPRAVDCADFRWVTLDDCEALPFGKADLMVLKTLRRKEMS